MKSIVEEYGRIIVLILAVFILLSFVLSRDVGGFIYALQRINPVEAVESKNNAEQLELYSKRLTPILEVTTEKLVPDTEYDLLSFVSTALARMEVDEEEGTKIVTEPLTDYTLTITKITDPEGNELPLPPLQDGKLLYSFSRIETPLDSEFSLISYRVTYELTDNYYSDYPVKTTKTYQFVVD